MSLKKTRSGDRARIRSCGLELEFRSRLRQLRTRRICIIKWCFSCMERKRARVKE